MVALFISIGAAMSGCASDKDEREEEFRRTGNAEDLIPTEVFQTVDLIEQLDPERFGYRRAGRKRWEDMDEADRVELAIDAFYGDYPAATQRLRRNRVQARIITVSDANCNQFLSFLLTDEKSRESFMVAMSGMGQTAARIVTGIGPARIIKGVGRLFIDDDPSRLESREFAGLTIQVIVEGIRTSRRQMMEEILARRLGQSVEEYPVEAAIRDALVYHQQCNIVTGMVAARDRLITQN